MSDIERVHSNVGPLKRQPLSVAKSDSITNYNVIVPNRSTPTIIQEEQDEDDNLQFEGLSRKSNDTNRNSYNGSAEESNAIATNKRPKLNGTSMAIANPIRSETNDAILIDSASESGESGNDVLKNNLSNTQRKTGLFNMSACGSLNTRNSSRTSSFGNGLNFYTHLEGRKSLFNGPNNGKSDSLNNSTLSLTSLNRRQFNASIYGSTSALSDSRLLNTFSPFYKGKTTYGGAAAYNKHYSGAGASAVRITPTLIRPTSSLSTLSSSSNSLANNINQVGENSTISSTAKRILDLINDFATPLSEAKKMANSLKTNPNTQIPHQAKNRLNESDLNASRVMRLSQVRTPYCRPAVILQPSGNASGRGTIGGLLPPVKELQVPTMSQLLQMKKMQNSTENARKVTQNTVTNVGPSEYSLPESTVTKTDSKTGTDQDKQKHTNKIRSKVISSLRPSAASKDLQTEEPPPPVNLPNIAFPLMQSVPKIDIQINNISVSSSTTPSQSNTLTLTSNTESLTVSSAKTTTCAFNPTSNKNLTQTSTMAINSNEVTTKPIQSSSVKPIATFNSKSVHIFKFSEPLQIGSMTPAQNITKTDICQYKFSSPLDVKLPTPLDSVKTNNTQPKQPQLKEGSCLDALKIPSSLSTTTKANTLNTSTNAGFGDQFKKSSNDWECDACMIRNKSDVSKCIACETPRKQNSASSVAATLVTTTLNNPSFGLQFKKSSDEWECDTCMIRNKQENTKCVACETVRKGTTTSLSSQPSIKSSFGDAFKPKSDTWECPTCLISNKNEILACVACQTKKPGSATSISVVSSSSVTGTQFKFGFANANNNKTATDDIFKTLAAEQKASKWECDACMTRNEFNRTKCACCEQPKPGIVSAESTSLNSSKFKFGATASAKFSFGFGAGSNVPKEADKNTELTNKTNDQPKSSAVIFGVGKTQPVSPQVGFQFEIKPSSNSIPESKKDETDGKMNPAGFKIGTDTENGAKASGIPVAQSTSTGFTFGSKLITTTSTSTTATLTSTTSTVMSSNAIAVSTPSVKFSLSSTTTSAALSNDKPTGVAAPTFNFGSSTTTSSVGGFSFGTKMDMKPAAIAEEKKPLENFAFKAPNSSNTLTPVLAKSTGFVFGASTTNASSTITTISSTITATTATSLTTTASVKPMFSFSSPVTSISQATSSQVTPAFGGFNFGSNSVVSTKSTTLFSNVTSTSTATTTSASNTTICLTTSATTTTTTTPASTNIFGSFGSSSNASATPLFGSSINPPANNNLSTVSSSTNNLTTANVPQFGTFTNKTTQNVFGSFGVNSSTATSDSSVVNTTESKPTLPVFGNVTQTSTSQASQSNPGGFVFGSKPSLNNTTPVSVTSTTSSVTSTSSTWPKNSFVFGSLTPAPTSITNENKETPKPSLFGSFSSPNSALSHQQQTSSIFGVPSSNIALPPSTLSSTLNSGPTNSSTNLFGTNSAPAATSIFGANSSGNAVTPAPAFGSSPFGGAASSTSVTPTFGSTAASGTTTFGGFGGASGNSSTTNVTEIKKPEAAFNFGSSPSTQNTSVSKGLIIIIFFIYKLMLINELN